MDLSTGMTSWLLQLTRLKSAKLQEWHSDLETITTSGFKGRSELLTERGMRPQALPIFLGELI
jgi:hypothetical protein